MCEVKSGFKYSFDPKKCEICKGKCCIGESGYIWINDDEIYRLSKHLNLEVEDFKKRYLIKIGSRYSIREKPYNFGFACKFFDEKTLNCSIYEFRPNQCRTFPFWDYFKKNFKELELECIGVKLLSN
ncbi:YkgJ family cysteine cluster protein [Campylobacter sp. FMV-PI01]|uniref:YkgJ family cysteine cluster protein n=1 Tax=Campylobacter portucalensis TaxID=2608384 RepID=A0A6L5WKT0_9BACT|nr:YkgJ family cysteine cluster protein [Campylobacter portucalensis]MSN97012.1 YkgJ family cysteine cluster protein [Campylobacter portucalensis]